MKKAITILAAAAAAVLMSASARAGVEANGGDYTALPAGTNLAILYYQYATRDKLYSNGSKVPINPGLDSNVGVFRGVHFMELGGYIIDPQYILPFGRLNAKDDIAALGSKSSIGDLLLGATLWTNKPGSKENFGITPWVWLPTGTYDRNQPLNLGENRWKAALQAGWIKPLAPALTMDLIADFTIFGKNDDANNGVGGRTTKKQKVEYEFQAHLRYHVSPTFDLRGGLFHITGGETKLGGVSQNDRQSLTKFNVGASAFVGPTTQLLATYGRDIERREGFKTDNEIQLRLLQIF